MSPGSCSPRTPFSLLETQKAPASTLVCLPRLRRLANVVAGFYTLIRTDRKLPSEPLARSLAALSACAVAVLLVSASHAARSSGPQYVAPAKSGALFLVSGHGYGHGVGMGQWGAQGYAQQGYTYDQILEAYYPGTTLGDTTKTTIRVLLASGKKKLIDLVEEADRGRGRRRHRPHARRPAARRSRRR